MLKYNFERDYIRIFDDEHPFAGDEGDEPFEVYITPREMGQLCALCSVFPKYLLEGETK